MGDRGGTQRVAKLVLSQFRSKSKSGKGKSLLLRTTKILNSGHVQVPKWFEPMKKVVPSSPYISAMKPKQIVYPEDHLINAYYNRNPHARFYPIDLTSNQPHFVRNFAKRQLKVQRQRRVSEQEALAIVEAEAEDEDRRAKEAMEAGRKFVRHLTPTHDIEKNWIRRVQAEEEKAWQISKSIHVMEHYRELMKSGMDNIFDESDNETKERRADEEEARQVMSDSGLERHEVNMALKHLKELSEGDLEEIVSNLGEGSSEPHSR